MSRNMDSEDGEEGSVVNIANVITALRFLVGLPVMYYVYIGDMGIAIMLYVSFLMLDVIDGHSARKFGCETLFGKNFDFIVDGAISTGIVVALLLVGRMPLLFILLIAVPLLLKTVYIYRGIRIEGNSFVPAKWRKLNGITLFIIPLAFMIDHVSGAVIAYACVAYTYISSVKYVMEIRELEREGE